MNSSMKMGLVKVTLFSILIVLSGMAAIASADDGHEVSMFYGNVTLNDADASPGTAINAYIDGKLRGGRVTDTSGKYFIDIIGNGSEDDGKDITFKVCGATADQTAVWHASYQPRPLNLTAEDSVAPAVTNATATPQAIVANGTDTTQLNVTVIDGCRVGNVTVNLSAIGGSDAQETTRVGDTYVYTVTVTADANTAPGTYCLYVNASDVFENYDDSVCIDLVIKDVEAPVVSNPDANPATIVANGTHESLLSVTVVDDSSIDFVTVDLSAIGGSDVQTMSRVGTTDVYTVTVTAAEGTSADTYCLQVNASDEFGECNTSVYITLEIVETTTYAKGDLDHNGDVADAVDVSMMLQASVGDIIATSEYDLDDNGDNADAVDVSMMLQASVGDIAL